MKVQKEMMTDEQLHEIIEKFDYSITSIENSFKSNIELREKDFVEVKITFRIYNPEKISVEAWKEIKKNTPTI